ncbi:CubicO group peptidase (beta-lactamase class C family) [Kitasatospora gansuensis]|uniref:CubicO group peptidase (Beta-lactamase class C family) n=1 Tax=Kitasatospora gansuensis TaxID=258050 RepID=A0A7W7WG11_9ACTN|nr:serine hydrolase domain-containing protein [Kitasatospora gansuensis]MBB4945751.1 CubicO group peptidase (beta-lactamase class C family) [Kitasatospora gansuensis]
MTLSGGGAALAALVAAVPGATAVTLVTVSGEGSEVRCHGREFAGGPETTADTGYELGSVTKTFTALLLAELADRGAVTLDDPLSAHLPGTADCTLHQLATHTAGLPRLPPGLLRSALPQWYRNPYAAFDDDRLLAAPVRPRSPGRVRYSNFGVALLGRALAERTGTPYPELLAELVCAPLGLTATDCAEQAPGRALGHRRGRPLPPWRIPGLPAAGALRSTGRDLLRYLTAHLDPATPALRTVRLPLAWSLRRTTYFHSGGTRGCTAFVGFDPERGTALAALANTGPFLGSRFVQTAYDTLPALTPRRGLVSSRGEDEIS